MGYTVRVEDWRYTCWIPFNGTRNRGEWAITAELLEKNEELYDHRGDNGENWADGYENENVAAEFKELAASLFNLLRSHFDTPGPSVWPQNGDREALNYTGDG
eukprot:UC4_evm1s100